MAREQGIEKPPKRPRRFEKQDKRKPLTRLEQLRKISLEVEDTDPKQIEKVFELLTPLKAGADAADCREIIGIFIANIWWHAAGSADEAMATDKNVKKAAAVLEAAITRLETAAKPFEAHLDEDNRLVRGDLYALSHEIEIEPALMKALDTLKRKAAAISVAKSKAAGRNADYKRYAVDTADRLIGLYSSRPLVEWSRTARVNLAHTLLGEVPPKNRSGMEKYSAKPGPK